MEIGAVGGIEPPFARLASSFKGPVATLPHPYASTSDTFLSSSLLGVFPTVILRLRIIDHPCIRPSDRECTLHGTASRITAPRHPWPSAALLGLLAGVQTYQAANSTRPSATAPIVLVRLSTSQGMQGFQVALTSRRVVIAVQLRPGQLAVSLQAIPPAVSWPSLRYRQAGAARLVR